MKDSLIIFLIITMVIIGNIISQNILKMDSENIIEKLEKLQQNLETESVHQLADEVYQLWDEIEEKWSIIVLHQELDNIKTAIIAVKSSVESGDLEYSYQQIENSIFLVQHQTEKWSIKWKNIF